MSSNRLLGIFVAVTILMWVLIFALSPQPKYQPSININIPELPEPSVDTQNRQKIEFEEVNIGDFKIDTKDTLPSAKERVATRSFADGRVSFVSILKSPMLTSSNSIF